MTDVNNNLKYVLSTDILAFALFDKAKVGLTSGHFSGDGYETEEVYPWGIVYGSNELGATQPNIGMIVGVKKLCLNGYPTQK